VQRLNDAIDLRLRNPCGDLVVLFAENQLDAAVVRIVVDHNSVLWALCIALLKALEVLVLQLEDSSLGAFRRRQGFDDKKDCSREKTLDEMLQ